MACLYANGNVSVEGNRKNVAGEGKIVVIEQMEGDRVWCTDWSLASSKLIRSNRRDDSR